MIPKRIHFLLLVLAGIVGIFIISAASQSQIPQFVIRQTNIGELQQMSRQYAEQYRQEFRRAREIARRYGLPVRKVYPDGRVIHLQKLSPTGLPMYYTTFNWNAAKTVSTNDLWPTSEPGGGGLFDGLSGNGMTIGEWDAGQVLESHQELIGRVNPRDDVDTADFNNHSTHVAGTLIATGVVDSAHGMAFQASLHSYDFNNDKSEMSQAADSLLLSNHSYGFIVGWEYNYYEDGRWVWFGDTTVSSAEDYYFGYYAQEPMDWDEITFNAPYYLPVVAAGNDRNDGLTIPDSTYWLWNGGDKVMVNSSDFLPEPDGPFDCIAGAGVAKNVLTVGAVHDVPSGYSSPSDVNLASFSSAGPIDDGRIKPDIVANGIGLYSSVASSDNAYASFNGTSMAAPNAAGSLLLLQQLYMNRHGGAPMRASTLKALAIHTADEAGNTGPDYKYGWGLLNTSKAAETIDQEGVNATILEGVLEEGRQYIVKVRLTTSKPLIATLCWTDPPAVPPLNTVVDPEDRALVNDLDMQVLDSDGTLYEPWVLDRDDPTNPAMKGDNRVDNAEQVFIAAAQPDSYMVVISNDGPLQSGTQNFSLVVNSTAEPNEPPDLVAHIPDTTVDEDFGSLVLADLDTVFQDPEGAALNYRVETNDVIDALIQGSVLEIVSVQNAYGTGEVIIFADDMQSETSDTIHVTIRQINDPPLPFALEGPPDGFLNTTSLKMPFTWESAADVEADTIRYLFRLTDSLAFDTTAVLYQSGFLLSVVQAGLPRNTPIHWDVRATDQQDTTRSSNGPFGFLLSETLELSASAGGEPEEYTLFQNFPNPFTGSHAITNIGYGLIEQAPVRLTIYDARGYKVATLVNAYQSQGWHKAQWNGTDEQGQPVSAGVYIYQIIAGDFRTQKKMVILR